MAEFIGLTVFLTLHDAEHTQLRGLVREVVNRELVLSNGSLPLPSASHC